MNFGTNLNNAGRKVGASCKYMYIFMYIVYYINIRAHLCVPVVTVL